MGGWCWAGLVLYMCCMVRPSSAAVRRLVAPVCNLQRLLEPSLLRLSLHFKFLPHVLLGVEP